MMRAAVVGHPISHSLSPALFGYFCHHLNHKFLNYSSEDILASHLPSFLLRVRQETDWVGLNITIPHKVSILPFLDHLSEEVEIIGAVNVVFKNDGQLWGFNTDTLGIEMTLKRHFAHVAPEPWENQRAVVLGAGGAARAVAYVLGKKGLKRVDFINRDLEKAQSLAKRMSSFFPGVKWDAFAWPASEDSAKVNAKGNFLDQASPSSELVSLWINTTPLGMTAKSSSSQSKVQPEFLPKFQVEFQRKFQSIVAQFHSIFSDSRFPTARTASAFDLIYSPENTPFLQAAEILQTLRDVSENSLKDAWSDTSGCVLGSTSLLLLGGLEMLVEQALATWKIWIGPISEPESEPLKLGLLSFLRSRPIFLTGMMGAGKSTVGSILAQKLGRKFVDLDQMIELETGQTVQQIFAEKGEKAFRELETRHLLRFVFSSGIVLSLGGGTLTQDVCLSVVKKVGTLIYLAAQPDNLQKRIQTQGNTRPLLAQMTPSEQVDQLKNLLKQRVDSYSQALLHVETEGLTPEEVAVAVVKTLSEIS